MNPALSDVWEHILGLGLGALAHANRHAAYISFENDSWSDLSVLQAAHAAELLIKARIAQEHPLLIFERLPRSKNRPDPLLGIQDLFRNGKTVEWSDLPERLWATTGLQIPNEELFKEFGRKRNGIQHFAPLPRTADVSGLTLKFIYEVIDPFIHESWGLFAIDYDEDYEQYVYLVQQLIVREIPFLVSEEAASTSSYWDWGSAGETYRKEMESRIQRARPS